MSLDDHVLNHLYKLLWDGEFICGCGDPDAAYELVWKVVKHFDDKDKHADAQIAAVGGDRIDAILGIGSRWVPFEPSLTDMLPDSGIRQIVVGAVDGLGLIEHGSSYYSSWLTKKGKWFLWAVESVGGIDGIDEKLDMVGFPQHGGDWKNPAPCTDECWKIPSPLAPISGAQSVDTLGRGE